MAGPLSNSSPRKFALRSDITRSDFLGLCKEAGAKPLHADSLFASAYRQNSTEFSLIPDLPENLRAHLRRRKTPAYVSLLRRIQSRDGTQKLLLQFPDGNRVETVLIPAKDRLTLCLSTQAGCAMGCHFCMTSSNGLQRNLTAAEMISQTEISQQLTDNKIRNIVLMGMGEPLHNFDEVARFIFIVTDPQGMALSPRRVTISTSGLIPGIHRMIDRQLPCNLAISLNATTDEIRNRIMPVNRAYPINKLIQACRLFSNKTGKRLLIEYVLIAGLNDTDADAERLVALLQGLPCTINLLPFNESESIQFRRPDPARVAAFRSTVARAGYVTVVRESRGGDIMAACGQLKAILDPK